MSGNVTLTGWMINTCRILIGKSEGKIHLGKSERTFGDDVKMDLKDIGCDDVDWIELVQESTMAGSCRDCNISSSSLKKGTFVGSLSANFSKSCVLMIVEGFWFITCVPFQLIC
jgi:hypothetical protein